MFLYDNGLCFDVYIQADLSDFNSGDLTMKDKEEIEDEDEEFNRGVLTTIACLFLIVVFALLLIGLLEQSNLNDFTRCLAKSGSVVDVSYCQGVYGSRL